MKSLLQRFAYEAFASTFGACAVFFALVAEHYASRTLMILSAGLALIYVTLIVLNTYVPGQTERLPDDPR